MQICFSHFLSAQFGMQVFHLQGRGLSPSSMDSSTIHASLHSNAVHVVSFTNPLDVATFFSISLKGRDREHFCLLVKRSRSILLQPGVSVDIPVMFAPESMHRHEASIVIAAANRRQQQATVDQSDRLQDEEQKTAALTRWTFPVVGQPELRPFSRGSAPELSCRAKERIEQQLEVTLVKSSTSSAVQVGPLAPGWETGSSSADPAVGTAHSSGPVTGEGVATAESAAREAYTHKLVCSDDEYAPLISQATGVKLLKHECGCGEDDGPTKLVFAIVFAPPRAFRCVYVSDYAHAPVHISVGMNTIDGAVSE